MTRYLKSFNLSKIQPSPKVLHHIDWLIDWIVFYAILAVFQLHRKYQPYNIIPLYVICVHPQPLFIMQFKFKFPQTKKGNAAIFWIWSFYYLTYCFFVLFFYALPVIFQPYNSGFYYLKVKFWRFTSGTYDFLLYFEPTI